MEFKQTSEDFNFQYYVDMAKQKKIDWHVFVKLIQDFSYSDISRLKYVNAILLTKLTDSYSDMDRLKYLNVILMNRFKDLIQIEFNVEVISENDNFEVVKILNDETIKERSSDSEIQILGTSVNERQENFELPIHQSKDFIQIEDDVDISENEDAAEFSHTSTVDHDLTDEISSNSDIQTSFLSENAIHEDFDLQIIEKTRCDSYQKSFSQKGNIKEQVHTVENE